jgi:microcystin-dependent protein
MTSTFPVGTIVPMLGQSSSSPPSGWLLCDGSKIPSNYPELAKLLPNGFRPDLRNYVLVGAGDLYNSGSTQGSLTHTLAVEEMPSHQHYGMGNEYTSGNALGVTNTTSDGLVGYFIGAHTTSPAYLWGTTFAGGIGDPNHAQYTNLGVTYMTQSSNKSFGLLQPSYAVNYYIYAGDQVVSASEEKGNV